MSSAAEPELREIYDLLRNTALNRMYYGKKLARIQWWNNALDMAMAAGATGSSLTGLAFWKMEIFQGVWVGITAAAGILAFTKPFLQLNKRVEKYSKLFTGHQNNFLSVYAVVLRIRRKRSLDEAALTAYESAEQRYVELSREDDPNPDLKLQFICEEAVSKQFPSEWFWYPETDIGTSSEQVVSALRPLAQGDSRLSA